MVLAVMRHAESIENASKYNGFYENRRPYSGKTAHQISRDIVGLTPLGIRQALWLGGALADLAGPGLHVYTSTYRRAIDTAAVAFTWLPVGEAEQTPLLDEQHYGDATYMTKAELFTTYPECETDRQTRKHLWVPPGGGESLADGVRNRARDFVAKAATDLAVHRHIIAVTHHTTILALRSVLERRPITNLVEEARAAKTPTAGIFRYGYVTGTFELLATTSPPPL